MSNVVKQRLLKGFAAQGFAQAVNVLIQVFNVPLFLLYWGKGLYGEWLLISTIPTYLTFSDFGFGSAAATDMTMRVAKGDRQGAIVVYQSVMVLITGVSFVAMLTILGFIQVFPLDKWFKLTQISHSQSIVIASLLTLQVFIALQQGLLQAGFRCDGNYAWGVTVSNLQRLAEFLVGAFVVMRGGQPIALAASVLAVGAISNGLIRLDLMRRSPWIAFGWRYANLATIKQIAGPAIAYMGFPIGHALSLQGVVTVIGLILGPAAVVVFSTTRTLTRFVWQILNTIANTICVELSVALGGGNYELARSLHRRACQASVWLACLFGGSLYLFGGHIYKLWTKGKITYDPVLFGLLLIVVLGNSLWSTSYVVSMAVNRHQKVAVAYILATGLSLGISALLMHLIGLHGAAIALMVVDWCMNVYVLRSSLSILHDDWLPFFRSLIQVPFGNRIKKAALGV
jgi:O-antigen/teichoic acid export membrane protein